MQRVASPSLSLSRAVLRFTAQQGADGLSLVLFYAGRTVQLFPANHAAFRSMEPWTWANPAPHNPGIASHLNDGIMQMLTTGVIAETSQHQHPAKPRPKVLVTPLRL